MKRTLIAIGIATALSGNAFAGTTTGSNKATATLASTCSISGTTLSFGDVPVNAAGIGSGTGNIALTCTRGTSYTIRLNAGANTGSSNSRLMVDGKGNQILYAICATSQLDSSSTPTFLHNCAKLWYTSVYGDDYTVTGTGSGGLQNFPTYGFLSTGYFVPGTYTDTITATISY